MPTDNQRIVINFPVLLDTVTARLKSLNVTGNAGRLVFSPDEDEPVKLISGSVLIDTFGALKIGSPDCKFDADAEIVLTGEIDVTV